MAFPSSKASYRVSSQSAVASFATSELVLFCTLAALVIVYMFSASSTAQKSQSKKPEKSVKNATDSDISKLLAEVLKEQQKSDLLSNRLQ